jgi:hypothetical protein
MKACLPTVIYTAVGTLGRCSATQRATLINSAATSTKDQRSHTYVNSLTYRLPHGQSLRLKLFKHISCQHYPLYLMNVKTPKTV